MLVSPTRNLVRNQAYEAQIKYYYLPIKKRTLQFQLKKNTKKGQYYKIVCVAKKISPINKKKQVDYGKEHKDKDIFDF